MDAPRTVFLELTSHCNMHCAFCPSDLLRRAKGRLDPAAAGAFLDGLHAQGMRPPVLLNVLGEPLLNKDVYPLLDRLEAEGHLVTLITNMTLLGDPEVRRELLRHSNLTLALSLQTATPESYRMRGYPQMPFKEFLEIAFQVVEDKFRLGSGARLEIHVASGRVLAGDATIQSDSPLSFWPNFPSPGEERRWIARTMGRLEALARRLRRLYPDAYAAESDRVAALYKDHLGSRIARTRRDLPPDFLALKDDVFWGYMPLPHTLLVFKSFELWTRDDAFLRQALPPDKAFYVEENPGPRACPMTDSLGLLSNGKYVLCCLDYEGEMDLGTLADTPVADVLADPRRARVRADALSEPLCRRCRGNLFVFDTAPLPGTEQTVDKFGRGWWPPEPGLHGRGGRWTRGKAWAYVLARIPAQSVRLSFLSPYGEGTDLRLTVAAFDEATRAFTDERSFGFRGPRGRESEMRAGFAFRPGRLYRLEIDSPVFVPAEASGGADPRRLGLAVHSLRLAV